MASPFFRISKEARFIAPKPMPDDAKKPKPVPTAQDRLAKIMKPTK